MDKTETKGDLDKQNENQEIKHENGASEKTPEQETKPLNQGAEEEVEEEEEGEDKDVSAKEDPITRLEEELENAKDKYIRLYSEFENFRKRTAREKLELIQSANEQLIKALLPVADDFERAENSFPDKSDKDLAGFFLIRSKFSKTLEIFGARSMDVARGSAFDADLHEAISQVDAPEPDLKGKIVDVVEKGYLLNDKVIRYAKVVVGK